MFLNRNLFSYINEGLLFLRLTMGTLIAIHGLLKMLGGEAALVNVGKAMAMFGFTDYFYYFGLVAALSELVGGILIFLGLFTRLGCLVIMATLAVATYMTYDKGFMAYSRPLEIFLVFFTLFITGPGEHSIDRALFGRHR